HQKISGRGDAMLVQVVGGDQQLLLRGDTDMPPYAAGAQCLIIGITTARTRSPSGNVATVLDDPIVLRVTPKS
uniref:hypothetical protein n=1 Tax=Salmonella sp. SAL4435 TaxID=3159890 RepID=UPI0039799C06